MESEAIDNPMDGKEAESEAPLQQEQPEPPEGQGEESGEEDAEMVEVNNSPLETLSPEEAKIVNTDIPERFQEKLKGRQPHELALRDEANWIFGQQICDYRSTAEIDALKEKIFRTLQLIHYEKYDIPFIARYFRHELEPELDEAKIWQIAAFDLQYVEFDKDRTIIARFLESLKPHIANRAYVEQHLRSLSCSKNLRELEDYWIYTQFLQSYYARDLLAMGKELEEKGILVRGDFIQKARQSKYDEAARRCFLHPDRLAENILNQKQIHTPSALSIGPMDLVMSRDQDKSKAITGLRNICAFAAIEIQCHPSIRRSFKLFLKSNGTLKTAPTTRGMKVLNLFHPSYRVKNMSQKLRELKASPEIFLEVLQMEKEGLITVKIETQENMAQIDPSLGSTFFVDLQRFMAIPTDKQDWGLMTRQVIDMLRGSHYTQVAGKSFEQQIIQEVKSEFKDIAEAAVLQRCEEKYTAMLKTGFYKVDSVSRAEADGTGEAPEAEEAKEALSGPIGQWPDKGLPQRERIRVMGLTLKQNDLASYTIVAAAVSEFGDLLEYETFSNLLYQEKPAEEAEQMQATEDKTNFELELKKLLGMLKKYHIELMVVSADCLEARKLKRMLEKLIAGPVEDQDENQDEDQDEGQNEGQDEEAKQASQADPADESALDDAPAEEANEAEGKRDEEGDVIIDDEAEPSSGKLSSCLRVIWGRPEIPKLFSQSTTSQKILKNFPPLLKQTICLARWEQNPMNEVFNLWNSNIAECQTLNLDLHPSKHLISRTKLFNALEDTSVRFLNSVGVDLNLVVAHPHMHCQLQFLSGLGQCKARQLVTLAQQLEKPIQSRQELLEKDLIGKVCYASAAGFLKIRVPFKDRDEQFTCSLLDQTRIHPRDEAALSTLCSGLKLEEGNSPSLTDQISFLMSSPGKLQEMLDGIMANSPSSRLNQMLVEDLKTPFHDPRDTESEARTYGNLNFDLEDIFYSLVGEKKSSLRPGVIVRGTISKILSSGSKAICRLENGLEARIEENEADFLGEGAKEQIAPGSTITGRVDDISLEDDTTFDVSLKCKPIDLASNKNYLSKLGLSEEEQQHVLKEDLLNKAESEDRLAIEKKLLFQGRSIQHQRFRNLTSTQAMALLADEENGEFYFRPSSISNDRLTLTWKFFKNSYVHFSIEELFKSTTSKQKIGSQLKIRDEVFDSLDDISNKFMKPINQLLFQVLQHPKFSKDCCSIEDMKQKLLLDRTQEPSKIPYGFFITDKYPQFLILCYIPSEKLVKEFIKLKPQGYLFHNQYFCPFQNLINWFKQAFWSRDYQCYLRRATSPQRIEERKKVVQAEENSAPGESKADAGAKDSSKDDPWGQKDTVGGWGNDGGNQTDSGFGHGRGGGHRTPNDDQGGGFGRGRGAGRGGGGGGDCFKCQQPGHFARECPNAGDGGGGGRGRGGRSFTCYNCNQEGHMSRECPEPRAPRNFGNRGSPYKRQRTDDFDCGDAAGGGSNPTGWEAGGGGGSWETAGNNTAGSGDGGGWGDAPETTENANPAPKQDPGGGDGDAWGSNPKQPAATPDATAGGDDWGSNPNTKQEGGGESEW